MSAGSPPDLDRFVAAQRAVWPAPLEELRAGRKRGHWMWFVFPQIAGLGRSEMARFYALRDSDEARAYLVALRNILLSIIAAGRSLGDNLITIAFFLVLIGIFGTSMLGGTSRDLSSPCCLTPATCCRHSIMQCRYRHAAAALLRRGGGGLLRGEGPRVRPRSQVRPRDGRP